MTNQINENTPKTGCAGFFQSIADQLSSLGNLFSHIDQLSQMIFATAKSVKDYIWSFFASTTPPAGAEKVNEVAMETLQPEKPPVAVVKQPEVVAVKQPEVAAVKPPEVAAVKQPEVAVVEQPDVEVIEQPQPNPFEKARSDLDPFFKVSIQNPVLPIKVSPLEMEKTPEISTKAREQVFTLKDKIERNFPLFGMSFYPHLNAVEGKTFLANLGEEPYLIQAKTNAQHEKTRLEASDDHLTIFHQKRALVFYPLQK